MSNACGSATLVMMPPADLFPVVDEAVLEEGLEADPGKVLPHGQEKVQVLVQVRAQLELRGAAIIRHICVCVSIQVVVR